MSLEVTDGCANVAVGRSKMPYRKLSMRRNFSWVLVGNLVNGFAFWLLLVVLAKLGNAEMVGMYSLGLAISVPVAVLANLGLTMALVTDVNRDCPYGEYIAVRLITSAAFLATIVIIVLVAGYPGQTALVIMLVAVATMVTAFRELLLSVMKRNECMNLSARSQMLVACSGLAVFVPTFWLTRSLVLSIIAIIVVRLAVALLHDVPTACVLARTFGRTTLRPVWTWRPLVTLGLTSGPLAVAMALGYLAHSIPRYILERHHGTDMLGYFAALAAIMSASYPLINSLGTAVTPRLASYFVRNRRAYLRMVGQLVVVGLAMGTVGIVVGALFGRPILTLLFTAEYAVYTKEFTLLMVCLAIMFVVSFVNHSIVASRGFKHVSVVNALVCAVSLVASMLLIKPYGMVGACWALLAMSGCWLMALLIVFVGRVRTPLVSAAAAPIAGAIAVGEDREP